MTIFLSKSEVKRAERIIDETINELRLDLSGLEVLTEVGSGYFSLTAIIALMANADRVFAWTRDSVYGGAEDIVSNCETIISTLKLPNCIEFAVNSRPSKHIASADIITNSGFIRPLNKELLSNVVKKRVVIPLMYEKWEWREGEIDKDFCDKNGILIGGTWEGFEALRVFDYCGHLAAKMSFEAGLEIYRNKIIIWSNDDFGKVIEKTFSLLGAEQIIRTVETKVLYENIKSADFIFFCDYHDQRQLIGDNGIIDVVRLKDKNPAIKIVHLIGDVDPNFLKNYSIESYPEKKGKPQTMTYTLAHLGVTPLIKLQAGGLKAAECLYRGIDHPICQKV